MHFLGVLFCLLLEINTISSKSESMPKDFSQMFYNCIDLNEIDSCYKLIEKSDLMQLKAIYQNKFSCQTRLLSLQSNLIMFSNKGVSRNTVNQMFDEVKAFCYRL